MEDFKSIMEREKLEQQCSHVVIFMVISIPTAFRAMHRVYGSRWVADPRHDQWTFPRSTNSH